MGIWHQAMGSRNTSLFVCLTSPFFKKCEKHIIPYSSFRFDFIYLQQNNKNLFTKTKMKIFKLFITLLFLGAFLASCSDKVDESNLYVFKGKSAYQFLESSENLSNYAYLMSRVQISSKSPSVYSDLLSQRGNFTVFAPTNEAIQEFLDSVYTTKNFDITQTEDTVAEFIIRNSIIDNGESEAYQTTDMNYGTLGSANMNDRYLQISFDNDSASGKAHILINNKSRIVSEDNEVSNGYIHAIDRVIDMSNSSLPDLIKQTPNLRIFSRMLEITGWADSLVEYIDLDYEYDHPEFGSIDPGNTSGGEVGPSPEHRYIGYTAFTETDSVFETQWGIPAPVLDENNNVTNYAEIEAKFIEKCREAYPQATDEDLTSHNNAVNQFISYHLLPERIIWNNLVVHHNEMGYSYKNPTRLTIDCWEYYETMGKPRRLLKLTEGSQTNGIRLNRHCTYDNSFFGTYEELVVDRPGALVTQLNGGSSTNALNGFYYPIDEVLVYDDDVPGKVLNERLRFDFAAICPELMTNGMRQVEDNRWRFIPSGYISTFWYTDDTKWRYVPYHSQDQHNMQGDEINIIGQYDLTFKLPPVPFEGTWELRMCAPEIQHFGMFQVYLGTDKNNPTPIGLPLDFRVAASNPKIGWKRDPDDGDMDEIREIDKNMRNQGYMKNNKHNGCPRSGAVVTTSLRAVEGDYIRLRKILWSGNMKPNETYYVRIKSVLDNTRTCCMLDYFEMVPKSVYNGESGEDPW